MPKSDGYVNLIPAKPGEIRNPEGRKTYGAYVKEHWNSIALKIEKGELSYEDLKEIATNDINTNRRTAAMRMLLSIEDLEEFKEMMDRTSGKSSQPVTGEGGGPIEVVVKVLKQAVMDDV